MISVVAAKKIIAGQVVALPPLRIPLPQAAGLVLAADVLSAIDMPPFAQSSMDGYAFSFEAWKTFKTFPIAGVVPAGSDETIAFSPGQAVRIFTGAPVPSGADTVVMQEKATVINGNLSITDETIAMGQNVRPKGAEIKTGDLALAAGTVLSPAATGFLTGLGITHVDAYPKPVVSLIMTGRELQQAGNALKPGQVYESNSAALTAALRQLNIQQPKVFWADDDLDALKQILQAALAESNVVLLTGGISVGDYDFVLEATNQCDITKLFHRLKQRPGKPLYFGKKEQQLVFGLPGNPSSVLTCFYEYVLPALQQLSSQRNTGLKKLQVPLAKKLEKNTGLTLFLKGFYDGEKVVVLDAQESYRLSSFAHANCLLQINEDTTLCDENEKVEIHLLPGN